MDKDLFFNAITRVMLGIIIVALLIFLPAGTTDYWKGWLLMTLLFVPMVAAGFVMMFKNPDLLRKRLNAKEKEMEQKEVVALSALMFIASFVFAGLNFRFGWFRMPDWISWASAVVFVLAYVMYAEVLRENSYLSRTIEVQEGQKVIDTGLYGIVRHPMYAATLFLFLAMPLILGSLISFMIMLLYVPIIAKRIRNEEKVLVEGLDGYAEYLEHVKYKVIPFIW